MERRGPRVGISYLLQLRGTYISAVSTVPSMVGLASAVMVMLPLGAGKFGRVLLVLRMDGRWMMITSML